MMPSKKNKKPHIYEHLEHYLKKTTYAHRLQWLQEANEWVRLLEKERIIRPVKL
jgi:hypothetical protein